MAIQKTFNNQYPTIQLSDLDDNFEQVDLAYDHANGSFTQANSSFIHANSSFTQANGSFEQANSSFTHANGSFQHANASFNHANSAYNVANTANSLSSLALPLSGGTITGNLTVTGNLSGNLSGNISTSTSVTGDLYVSGVSNIKIPFYTVYMDEASRTTPSSFAKTYTGSYVSYGDIIVPYSPSPGTKSHLYEMTVNASANTSVTQRVWQTDDTSYYWLNGSQIDSVAGGNVGTTITWNLITGDNLIQIFVNNSGGGGYGLTVLGDFFIRYPNLRFKV